MSENNDDVPPSLVFILFLSGVAVGVIIAGYINNMQIIDLGKKMCLENDLGFDGFQPNWLNAPIIYCKNETAKIEDGYLKLR